MPSPAIASRLGVAAAALLVLSLALAPAAAGGPSNRGRPSADRDPRAPGGRARRARGRRGSGHNRAIDRLEPAQATLAGTRGEPSAARLDLERARELLSRRLVALYVNGQPSFVELLLTTGSLSRAQQAGDLLDQLARGDAGAVAGVRDRRAQLQALEARQAAAEAERRGERDAAADHRAEVAGPRAERRRVLDRARADLRRLIADRRERAARLAALEAARGAALIALPVAGGRDRSGNTFYYAHLAAYSPAASEGASVARGTVPGHVGDSGDAHGTPAHLHFEIHPGGGGPVPPRPIVTAWPRTAMAPGPSAPR